MFISISVSFTLIQEPYGLGRQFRLSIDSKVEDLCLNANSITYCVFELGHVISHLIILVILLKKNIIYLKEYLEKNSAWNI